MYRIVGDEANRCQYSRRVHNKHNKCDHEKHERGLQVGNQVVLLLKQPNAGDRLFMRIFGYFMKMQHFLGDFLGDCLEVGPQLTVLFNVQVVVVFAYRLAQICMLVVMLGLRCHRHVLMIVELHVIVFAKKIHITFVFLSKIGSQTFGETSGRVGLSLPVHRTLRVEYNRAKVVDLLHFVVAPLGHKHQYQ